MIVFLKHLSSRASLCFMSVDIMEFELLNPACKQVLVACFFDITSMSEKWMMPFTNAMSVKMVAGSLILCSRTREGTSLCNR